MKKLPKISVVTVCFNAENSIRKTIGSVMEQTYNNKEYVIVDGKSTDSTVKIIEEFMHRKFVFTFVSEEDKGLYYAMNKSIDMCTGDYIIFLNSGDTFKDKKVLEDMGPKLKEDIVYGNVIRKFKKRTVLEKYYGKHEVIILLMMGKMMNHQTIFSKSDLLKELRFNVKYKISADYDFIVRCKKNKCSFKYIDRTISCVDNIEGISSQFVNYDIMRKEDDMSLKEYFPFVYRIIKIPKQLVRFIKKLIIN